MGEERFRIKSGMTNEEIAGQARNDDKKKATGVCQLPFGVLCNSGITELIYWVIRELLNYLLFFSRRQVNL